MRKLKRRQIYLTDEEVKIAQEIGGGNMSKGIREALKISDDTASVRKATPGEATILSGFRSQPEF